MATWRGSSTAAANNGDGDDGGFNDCPICFGWHLPIKILDCGHSFCQICLEGVWRRRRRNDHDDNSGLASSSLFLPCPSCRKETLVDEGRGGVHGLTTNYALQRVLQDRNRTCDGQPRPPSPTTTGTNSSYGGGDISSGGDLTSVRRRYVSPPNSADRDSTSPSFDSSIGDDDSGDEDGDFYEYHRHRGDRRTSPADSRRDNHYDMWSSDDDDTNVTRRTASTVGGDDGNVSSSTIGSADRDLRRTYCIDCGYSYGDEEAGEAEEMRHYEHHNNDDSDQEDQEEEDSRDGRDGGHDDEDVSRLSSGNWESRTLRDSASPDEQQLDGDENYISSMVEERGDAGSDVDCRSMTESTLEGMLSGDGDDRLSYSPPNSPSDYNDNEGVDYYGNGIDDTTNEDTNDQQYDQQDDQQYDNQYDQQDEGEQEYGYYEDSFYGSSPQYDDVCDYGFAAY